ncbi:hypothetical protein S886_16540 [Salmonella enterica subsp. arizonae]|nr:hypothetical protein [Salmonella enterica subsp. arizonae]
MFCADFPALNPVPPASQDYRCGVSTVVILYPPSLLTNETGFNVTVLMLRTTSSLCGISLPIRDFCNASATRFIGS